MNARQAARDAAFELERAGVADAGFEAELLAREAGNLTRAEYFAGRDLRDDELTRFHDLLERRLQREPAAHILGLREFYGLEFEVTPHALVPRPETEVLVDLGVRELTAIQNRDRKGAGQPSQVAHPLRTPTSPPLSPGPDAQRAGIVGAGSSQPCILDVGTGTGCIAVSVALHAPAARVIATDVSPAALAVARRNRDRHGARVQFLTGDLAAPVRLADIILANLPYIPTDEVRALEPEVRDYEPIVALDGGPDGLSLIRRLIDDCAHRLRPRLLALEVAYGQAAAVEAYAKQQEADTEVLKDLAGIDRVVCCRWHGAQWA